MVKIIIAGIFSLAFGLNAGNILLGDQDVQISISPSGVVQSMKDIKSGTILFDSKTNIAWVMQSRKKKTSNLDYPIPEVKKRKNSVSFFWNKAGLPKITGTAKFDPGKKQFSFRISLINTTFQTIDSISYPALLSIPAKNDNYMIVAADTTFTTETKPLKSLKSFSVMYPGFMFMQFAGFKIGNSALLAYTDDPHALIKHFSFKKSNDKIDFKIKTMCFLKPNKKWDAPFGVILKAIPKGTYNEIAAEYGKWGRNQKWAEKKLADKINERPSLGKILIDGICRIGWPPIAWGPQCYKQDKNGEYHYISGTKYAKYEPYYDELLRCFAGFKKRYNISPCFWLAVWNGAYFDSTYPNYFPVKPWMGDFPQFKKNIIEKRYSVMYHMNTAHWVTTSPVGRDTKYQAFWRGKGYGYKRWANINHRHVNLGKSIEIEMKTIKKLADDEGIEGLYLDVVGHCFLMDDSPSNPFGKSPNGYQLAKIDSFKQIRNGITGPIMTEGRNEIILSYCDIFYGACGTKNIEDNIPMWEMVYGDCAMTHTFNSMSPSLFQPTMAQGGIIPTPWEWPMDQWKRMELSAFRNSFLQKVNSHVIGKRMLHFDKINKFRVSHWNDAVFIWNRAKDIASPAGPANSDKIPPANVNVKSSFGSILLTRAAANGSCMLTQAGDFSVDCIGKLEIDGKPFYADSSGKLLVVKSDNRYLILNQSKKTVTSSLVFSGELRPRHNLTGKFIRKQKDCSLPLAPGNNSQARFDVTLPPSEGLLLEEAAELTIETAI